MCRVELRLQRLKLVGEIPDARLRARRLGHKVANLSRARGSAVIHVSGSLYVAQSRMVAVCLRGHTAATGCPSETFSPHQLVRGLNRFERHVVLPGEVFVDEVPGATLPLNSLHFLPNKVGWDSLAS